MKIRYETNRRVLRDDELMHWKYIKREKKNGKWVYYYDKDQLKEDLGINARNRYRAASREKNRWDQEEKAYWKKAVDAHDTHTRARNYKLYKNEDQEKDAWKSVDAKYQAYERIYKRKQDADEIYNFSKSQYMKTPIGKLSKINNKIKKGANAIAKLFKKVTR